MCDLYFFSLFIENVIHVIHIFMKDLEKHLEYAKDPNSFIENCWVGFDITKMQPKHITPFEYQKELIRNIHQIDYNLIVKSRQMHVSTLIGCYIAWYVLFNLDKHVLIIAHNRDSGKRILEQIKTIIHHYDPESFKINNKTKLELKNGSWIQVTSPFCDAGKGCCIDLLYIDEAAYAKNMDMIWPAVGMALSCNKNSKCIIASSPCDNSWFNKMCLLTIDGETNFNLTRLHWSLHPIRAKDIQADTTDSPFEYTSPWLEKMKQMLNWNEKQIEQELECVINYKDKTSKNKTISLRLSNELYKKIQCKLQSGESISDYIRNLIAKDVGNIGDKL